MKKVYYFLALAASIMILDSCRKEPVPEPEKNYTPEGAISFSLSDGAAVTKAGFTGESTRIIARMQSDEKNGSGVLYVKSVLQATKTTNENTDGYSAVSYYTDGETRYWDDAYGRNGQISVYAVAIPNSTDATKLQESLITGSSKWASEETPNNSIAWSVSMDQSNNPLAAEDLAYSNNIQDGGKDGRYTYDYTQNKYPELTGATTHSDGRLVFTQATSAQASDEGHFDKGHLVFNHSLSRITVTLAEGTGFDGDKTNSTDFNFTNSGDNISLLGMNVSGTLDIKNGTWSSNTAQDITKMCPTGAHNGANGSYAAQMLPGYKFYENGTENVMQFVIDNNTYYVTQKQIYAALYSQTTGEGAKISVENESNGNYIEMKQQINYNFTITVNKTGISSVSATLASWVDVTGSASVNNAHLTFNMAASGSACDKDIDLYRLGDDNPNYDANKFDFSYQGKNWSGNYVDANKVKLEQTSKTSENKWSTNWFFESNKTYYHFRSVNSGTTINGNTDDNVNDYFDIEGGATASTDPHWGAPMTSSGSSGYLKYDPTKGYEDFLRPAIGATESDIILQEIHMMSNINVILQTNNDGSKVTLKDGETTTVVKITRLATKGTVEMGRGLVTPESTYTGEHTMTVPTTYFETEGTKTKPYTFTVVPQSLSRNFSSSDDTDYVGLFIQTPDKNQYYVVKKLSEIIATEVSDTRDHSKNDKIQRWYPGHNYTYTITISKKGIEAISCTVADWVNVTGDDINIDLES